MPRAMIEWEIPYKRIMKNEPDYGILRVIDNLCYASPSKKPADMFAPRGVGCILVGYPYCQKGYKLMNLENNKLFVSRDEQIFPFLLKEKNNEFLDVLQNMMSMII